jgi:hypothetical protein
MTGGEYGVCVRYLATAPTSFISALGDPSPPFTKCWRELDVESTMKIRLSVELSVWMKADRPSVMTLYDAYVTIIGDPAIPSTPLK